MASGKAVQTAMWQIYAMGIQTPGGFKVPSPEEPWLWGWAMTAADRDRDWTFECWQRNLADVPDEQLAIATIAFLCRHSFWPLPGQLVAGAARITAPWPSLRTRPLGGLQPWRGDD